MNAAINAGTFWCLVHHKSRPTHRVKTAKQQKKRLSEQANIAYFSASTSIWTNTRVFITEPGIFAKARFYFLCSQVVEQLHLLFFDLKFFFIFLLFMRTITRVKINPKISKSYNSLMEPIACNSKFLLCLIGSSFIW